MNLEKCTKLQRLVSSITFCDFSKNNDQLVGGDTSICIWDVKTGMIVKKLQDDNIDIVSVAFNQDGSKIVFSSKDDTVGIWDVVLNTVRILTPNSDESSVDFSPDGTKIVSGSWDDVVCIWDVESGMLIRTLHGHNGAVSSVAFSPDGTKIVSGSYDNTVCIWDVISGTLISTLQGHDNYVLTVAFSPDGTKVVSGSKDKKVCVWDIVSGTLVSTFKGHTSRVNSVAFSPNGINIVSSSFESVCVWETNSGKIKKQINVHNRPIKVKFNKYGPQIYVVDETQSICSYSYYVQTDEEFTQNMAAVYLSKPYRGSDKVIPEADAAAEVLGHPIIGTHIMNYAYGNKNRAPDFQRHVEPFFHIDEIDPLKNSGFRFNKLEIPKEALPSDFIFHPDNKDKDEIGGGKKSKKTRKYKKNKSKGKHKKNKSKRKYKK